MDIKTLMFINATVSFVCALLVTALWVQNRKIMRGTHLWAIQFYFVTATMLLVMLRGNIPDIFSMVVANSLTILGLILILMGLEQFLGKSGRHIHNYIYFALFTVIHFYFSIIVPNLFVRNLNLSLGILFLSFQIAWLMFRRTNQNDRPVTSVVGWVYVGYCAVSVVRIFENIITGNRINDFFLPSNFDALFVVFYVLLLIWLVAALGMMINRRLLNEIKMRKRNSPKLFTPLLMRLRLPRQRAGRLSM